MSHSTGNDLTTSGVGELLSLRRTAGEVLRRVFFFAAVLASSAASANLISLNAADYAPGTNASSLAPGLTMTGYQQSQSNSYYSPTAHATSIFSPEPGLASFGQYGDVGKAMTCFQRSGLGLSSSSCREGFSFLEFTFEEAADFVEITTIRTSEPAGLIAFGTDGQVLASCATLNSYGTQAGRCSGYNFSGDGNYYSLSIGMDSRAISRIWYGGVLGAGVQASAISYNVPEPSTLLLMSGGLFALLWMRRGSAGSMRTQAVTAN